MSTFLLDVNVLIALVREDHSSHKLVKRWFQRLGKASWATCPLTETGFVRVVVNPKFLEHPPEVTEALDMLNALSGLPGHQFWPMDFGFVEAVEEFQERLFGHQQVTHAYLLGLVLRKKGKLATLDRAITSIAGRDFAHCLEILG